MTESQTLHDVPKTATKQGPGFMSLVKAVALITVIVAVEVVGATILLPSAHETAQLGKEIVAATSGEHAASGTDGAESHASDEADENIHELPLGTFNVTRYNPEAGTTLTIDIDLFGTVLEEEVPEFHERLEKNRSRVGEQVILTLHGASASDLADAGLGLIKRTILEKTNRALGKPLVREVLFSKFNFVER
jgi:hypothetical protein